jgi:hypothetical protein
LPAQATENETGGSQQMKAQICTNEKVTWCKNENKLPCIVGANMKNADKELIFTNLEKVSLLFIKALIIIKFIFLVLFITC